MWYGVLGGKEMMQQSCKNLQKSIVLECDGQPVELPRLQGIVVLNIASYMGGTNFVSHPLAVSPRSVTSIDLLTSNFLYYQKSKWSYVFLFSYFPCHSLTGSGAPRSRRPSAQPPLTTGCWRLSLSRAQPRYVQTHRLFPDASYPCRSL